MFRRTKPECLPQADPMQRPDYVDADAWALRALRDGVATTDQQSRALKFIIYNICGTYDLAYRPGSSRDTDFALGKQRAGNDIVYFLNDAPTKTSADKVAVRRLGEQHVNKQEQAE